MINVSLMKFGFSLLICLISIRYSSASFVDDKGNVTNEIQTFIEKQHIEAIPKHFQVKGTDAEKQFQSYLNQIKELASKKNVTVTYKIKVVTNNLKKKNKKKKGLKKKKHQFLKTKRYNVPLKRQSMKLSSYEITMRRLAEDRGKQVKKIEETPTTELAAPVFSTKRYRIGKYKPIIRKVKTNFKKKVKPVRNNVLTL